MKRTILRKTIAIACAVAMIVGIAPVSSTLQKNGVDVPETGITLKVNAATTYYQDGNYYYSVNENNKAVICAYTGSDSEIVVPKKVGGYDVVSVSFHDYLIINGIKTKVADHSVLRSITLQEGVKSIGGSSEDKPFADCCWTNKIVLPDTLTTIGDYAFADIESLQEISIPQSVTKIGEYAFSECTFLETLTIPSSVKEIGDRAFNRASSLTEMTIPDTVTTLGDGLFYQCYSLTTVTLPSWVTKVNDYMFYSCYELTYEIPATVTEIGAYAFAGNTTIYELVIPENIKKIGKGAFASLTNLTAADLTQCGITEIPQSMFSYCTKLYRVYLPEGTKSIGEKAFYECETLDGIDFPESVTSIGPEAFNRCYSLRYAICLSSEGLVSIGNAAFYGCNLQYFDFPSTLETIGEYAFRGNLSLTEVTLPSSLKSLGKSAFFSCTGLTNLTISSGLEEISNGAFDYCKSLKNVRIPKSVSLIDTAAFARCESLEYVIYDGYKDDWDKIVIGESNEPLLNAWFRYGDGTTSDDYIPVDPVVPTDAAIYVNVDYLSPYEDAELQDKRIDQIEKDPNNGTAFYAFRASDLEDGSVNTYEEAEAYCESLGGHLATFNNDPELQKFVATYLVQQGIKHSVYIGLRCSSVDAQDWEMIDGSEFWQGWDPGEPSRDSGELYATLNWNLDEEWYTGWNDATFTEDDIYFLCQWDDVYTSSFDWREDGIPFRHELSSFYSDTGIPQFYETSYFNRLLENENLFSRAALRTRAASLWNGACFGLSTTMILMNQGKMTGQYAGKTMHDMHPPKENLFHFRDIIHCYFLAQEKSTVNPDREVFQNMESPDTFLRNLVAYARTASQKDEQFIFAFRWFGLKGSSGIEVKSGGHAVVACGYYFDGINHRIRIYDMNKDKEGRFIYLTIPKDYSDAWLADKGRNGYAFNNYGFWMGYYTYDTVMSYAGLCNEVKQNDQGTRSAARSESDSETTMADLLKEGGKTIVEFTDNASFILTNAEGETLSVTEQGNMTGNMQVYYKTGLVNGDEQTSRTQLVVNESALFNVDEIEEFDSDTAFEISLSTKNRSDDDAWYVDDDFSTMNNFYNVSASHADSFCISDETGIRIDSENGQGCQFSVNEARFIFDDQSGEEVDNLCGIRGQTTGTVQTSPAGNTVGLESEKVIRDLKVVEYNDDGKPEETVIPDSKAVSVDTQKEGEDAITSDPAPSLADAKVTFKSGKTKYAYTGNAIKPAVTVKYNGTTLSKDTDYKVTYSSNKNVGKTAKVTVTGIGDYTGTTKKTFTINPKGTSLKKLVKGKKKITVKWKKQAKQITGYQIQYSTSAKFKSGNKSVKVAKPAAVSKVITKLKAKKKYYVRIRTYKKLSGTTLYSAWSKKLSVKTQ